ncbi:MAG: PilZ domain-containing protein [Nitrospirae bacterium]|nr:PilZ domain-containing protein [Nitrospirota bacterium]
MASPAPKASKPTDGANRRLSERSPMMVLEIKGKYYDKIFIGYAENISRSGLFFSAANPPAVGATFPVEFVLPDNRTMVQCTCRVVWQHRYDTTGRPSVGVGVEFLDLDQAKRALIDQWVKRRSSADRPRTPKAKS